MGRQAESKLSGRIIDYLNGLSEVFAWKNHGNEYTISGLPDIICCFRGRFIAFEVKMPGKQDNVSPVQQVVHRQLRAAGGQVYVISSIAEAVAALQILPH